MADLQVHDAAHLAAELKELDGRRAVQVRFEASDTEFKRLFPDGTWVELIAGGFVNTEGPVWVHDHLLFADVPRNRIVRWRPLPEGPEVTTFRFPSGYPLDRAPTIGAPGATGLTLDRSGRLIACEAGNRRVTRTEPDGYLTILADRYQGRLLNRPNDVVVRSDGAVYFTDPVYRLPTPTESVEQPPGVYRVVPGQEPERLMDELKFPNGLAFSPDERVLYVADSIAHNIRAFDLGPDGRVRAGRHFADMRSTEPGAPDGMKVDQEGHVYCGGSGGLWVFAVNGRWLGRLVLPNWPRNLAWGDGDWRTLYITAGTAVYRVRVAVAGIPVASPILSPGLSENPGPR